MENLLIFLNRKSSDFLNFANVRELTTHRSSIKTSSLRTNLQFCRWVEPMKIAELELSRTHPDSATPARNPNSMPFSLSLFSFSLSPAFSFSSLRYSNSIDGWRMHPWPSSEIADSYVRCPWSLTCWSRNYRNKHLDFQVPTLLLFDGPMVLFRWD